MGRGKSYTKNMGGADDGELRKGAAPRKSDTKCNKKVVQSTPSTLIRVCQSVPSHPEVLCGHWQVKPREVLVGSPSFLKACLHLSFSFFLCVHVSAVKFLYCATLQKMLQTYY